MVCRFCNFIKRHSYDEPKVHVHATNGVVATVAVFLKKTFTSQKNPPERTGGF